MKAARVSAAEDDPAVRAEIRALRETMLAGFASVLAAIERQAPRPPAIDGDAAVGRALAELRVPHFSLCCEVIARSGTDAGLRDALAAALIDDPRQLGHCFDRLHKRGLITREPTRSARGWRWRV